MNNLNRLAVTILALLLSGTSVQSRAQAGVDDDTAERLLACDPISDPAEKMACFDAVVKGIKGSAAAPSAEAPDVSPPPASNDIKAAAPATVTISETQLEEGKTPTAEKPRAPSGVVAVENDPAPVMPDESVPGDVGLEDQQARAAGENEEPAIEKDDSHDDQSVQATIVTVTATTDDRFEVLLDNGQVWRETEGSRIRTPKVGSSVTITSGVFGSFMMKIGDDRRRARVRRTK